MENEDILEQQSWLKERTKQLDLEELRRLESGETYNTPDTDSIRHPEKDKPKDIDSYAKDDLVKSLTDHTGITGEPNKRLRGEKTTNFG